MRKCNKSKKMQKKDKSKKDSKRKGRGGGNVLFPPIITQYIYTNNYQFTQFGSISILDTYLTSDRQLLDKWQDSYLIADWQLIDTDNCLTSNRHLTVIWQLTDSWLIADSCLTYNRQLIDSWYLTDSCLTAYSCLAFDKQLLDIWHMTWQLHDSCLTFPTNLHKIPLPFLEGQNHI